MNDGSDCLKSVKIRVVFMQIKQNVEFVVRKYSVLWEIEQDFLW